MKKNTLLILVVVLCVGGLAVFARTLSLQKAEKGMSANMPERKLSGSGLSDEGGTKDDFNVVMNDLSVNMNRWNELSDVQKAFAVNAVIQLFQQQNQGTISNPAPVYAQGIDQSLSSNPEMMELPLDRVVFILAVMAYDFDNGTDADELAKQVLGPEIYQANRERLERAGRLEPLAA